jgi:EAL domain-containing protein (putative c-di-GMP-specific phosphodiesterase class I)
MILGQDIQTLAILKLQTDYIKIDGSLIKNLDSDANARVLVKTIVSFAKELGIKTIAEFVENEAIQNIVKELGVDYTQGYFFSPPMASPDFSK